MATQGVDFAKFLLNNFGIIGTLIACVVGVLVVVNFALLKLVNKLIAQLDDKLDTVSDSLKDLAASQKGSAQVLAILFQAIGLKADINSTNPQEGGATKQ
jgi:hypothetical protein